MEPISIKFISSSLGRVEFDTLVIPGNRKRLKKVRFLMDSGSDFTTLSRRNLDNLGYTQEFLESCPFHTVGTKLAMGEQRKPLQYIENVSFRFGDNRELQCCRIFFSLERELDNFFGSDILKYFNREVNYDTGILKLSERESEPGLCTGEVPIQICTIGQAQ
jgi:hypothetical protein